MQPIPMGLTPGSNDFVPTTNCTAAADQRGVDRPTSSGCDAVAFEIGTDSADPSIAKSGPISATFGDTPMYNLVVINHGPDDASGGNVTDEHRPVCNSSPSTTPKAVAA